jgi:hypothetical protein
MIKGLYSKLNATHAAIAAAVKVQKDSDAEPAKLEAARISEPRLREEVKKICAAIEQNEGWITRIESMIDEMNLKGWGSSDRSLAIRHLEDASSRLRRELGDHPQD